MAHCYPERLNDYPAQLTTVLQSHSTSLDADTRLALCKALVLLRNKQLLAPTDLLSLFFQLLRCQDRPLREFLKQHIISDISQTNAKHKNAKLNSQLQNFMYSMLRDSNQRAAKTSVDIMSELYKKNVWNDAKTVNVIVSGCFSKHSKVVVASLKFFLGSDEPNGNGSDDDSGDDEPTIKEVSMANKVNKKSRKREKRLEKVKKQVVKNQKKKGRAEVFNFSALQLVHDPQGLAERLMRSLEQGANKRFEVKLMILDVVSRLVGLHELILLNYYPYIQRFLQPHQREVTRILQFAAQASHTLVPPDTLEPLVRTLVNNFVTERNSSDAMAIGLNTVRELCARCPLAMTEELLQDLVEYRTYRDRSVMMAARSLLQLFRHTRPELLRRKDRGKPTEAVAEMTPQEYGQVNAPDHITGAEILLQPEEESIDINSESDEDSDASEWVDLSDEEDKKADVDKEESSQPSTVENKADIARQVVLDRLLTDEDFHRIDAEQARKQVDGARRGTKRRREDETVRGDRVRLSDIENIYKKRKHDKATRLETVRRGQEDRDKFGYRDGRQNEHCSRTNREKRKNKNFLMLKHKARGKIKRSFKDKQIALRNHLIKQKKMK